MKYSAYQPVLVKLNKDKDDKVLIEIDDCGPGVREGDLDHMMQAFYRGQDEQYKVTGAGLGLAIVQEIVEEHSGQIAFHNLRTKGLRAKVILPLFNHIVHELYQIPIIIILLNLCFCPLFKLLHFAIGRAITHFRSSNREQNPRV